MKAPGSPRLRVPLVALAPLLALVLAAPVRAATGAAKTPAGGAGTPVEPASSAPGGATSGQGRATASGHGKPASPRRGAAGHKRRRRKPGPPVTTVSLERSAAGAPVPSGFLGLSFEVGNLAQLAGYANSGDLVTLLRSLGPGVLRFGGVTADKNVAWVDARTPRPAWATAVIGEADLQRLGVLAARSGWHVLLTLNLGHYEPEAAAREAAAARAALGEWLAGLELGNEPNAYAHQGLREEPWTFLQYDAQVAAYRAAIEAAAPGVPIAGPDVSGSSAFETWGLGEVVNQPPALLTGHHYPLSCQGPPPPTIERLLSAPIRALEVVSLQRYLSVAQAGEIPFRLDEANSVSCGGVAGISNTFAGALWAAAYVSQAMNMEVDGINLHGNPNNCSGYTPLCATSRQAAETGELLPQPDWYALLLLRGLVGDRPVPNVLGPLHGHNLQVNTFLAHDGSVQTVIVDDDPPGTRRAYVRLKVGSAYRYARLLPLTAPAPTSLSGVRLAGTAVAADGTWTQPAKLAGVRAKDGSITLAVSPSRAMLLSIER